jgi:hypothetical protein
MKRPFLAVVLGLSTLLSSAQTATNFNVADCSGTQHDLFAELDAGNVVVLTWVMPCASCIGPALTTYNVAESFQATNPGRVHMYLCDDYANTNCTVLNSWRTSTGLANATTFSNTAINMNDYGGPGMPKVVVLGGNSHSVFYNANYTVDPTSLQQAITDALAAVNGIAETTGHDLRPAVWPNPANDRAVVQFNMPASANLAITLLGPDGRLVDQLHNGPVAPGEQRLGFNTTTLPAGLYLVRIAGGTWSGTARLTIAH